MALAASTLDLSSRGKGLIDNCVVCGLDLPLRLPLAQEPSDDWLCVGCGACYCGVLLEDAPRYKLKNIQRREATPATRSAAAVEDVTVDKFRETFRPKGTGKIALPPRDRVTCTLETPLSRQLDIHIAQGRGLQTVRQGPVFAEEIRRHAPEPYSPDSIQRFVRGYDQALKQFAGMLATLHAGRGDDLGNLETISQAGLAKAAEDMDLFVCLGINPLLGNYPGRHSLHTAMVAMAIAANLEWDQRNIVDLGIGCLLHDIGMNRVNAELFQDQRILTELDFLEIAKHPVYTFELLEQHLNEVPVASRMVAYQMHERINGTGYPRGRRGEQIHELAKIAAVADVFVALVSPRPHRAGMIPYYAMEHLLYGVRDGLFDGRVVRALLKTISLFPVGSFVALSDGRVGKVIRTNGATYDKPVLEVWDRGNLTGTPTVLNLLEEPNCRVVAPLVELGKGSGLGDRKMLAADRRA